MLTHALLPGSHSSLKFTNTENFSPHAKKKCIKVVMYIYIYKKTLQTLHQYTGFQILAFERIKKHSTTESLTVGNNNN